METFKEFLRNVDVTPPDEKFISEVIQTFENQQISSEQGLEGLTDQDVDKAFADRSLNCTGLAQRALWAANTANQIKRQKLVDTSGSSSASLPGPGKAVSGHKLPASEVQQIIDIVGTDISAGVVAKMLAEPNFSINIPALLKEAGMDGLEFHLQCVACVCRLFDAENRAAAKNTRTAYSYVDLTSKPFLPLWLPQDAVGGNHIMGSDWAGLNPSTSTSTLHQLGAALKAASSTPRFFRTFSQWLAAFNKYAVVAVGYKQLKWTQVMAYVNVISELRERQRAEHGSSYLTMLHDDVFR